MKVHTLTVMSKCVILLCYILGILRCDHRWWRMDTCMENSYMETSPHVLATSQITTRAVLPMTVDGVIYPIRNASFQQKKR